MRCKAAAGRQVGFRRLQVHSRAQIPVQCFRPVAGVLALARKRCKLLLLHLQAAGVVLQLVSWLELVAQQLLEMLQLL